MIAFVVIFAIAGAAFRPALSALLPDARAYARGAHRVQRHRHRDRERRPGSSGRRSGAARRGERHRRGFPSPPVCFAGSALLFVRIRTREKPRQPEELAAGCRWNRGLDGVKCHRAEPPPRADRRLFGAADARLRRARRADRRAREDRARRRGGAGRLPELGVRPRGRSSARSARSGSSAAAASRPRSAIGILLWGVPLIVIGAASSARARDRRCLVIVGFGNTLARRVGLHADAAGSPRPRARARDRARFESRSPTSRPRPGALVAPLVVRAVGVRWAFVIVGLVLPVAVVALRGARFAGSTRGRTPSSGSGCASSARSRCSRRCRRRCSRRSRTSSRRSTSRRE